jgi:hypothetical protein
LSTNHEQIADNNVGVVWRVQGVPLQDVSTQPAAIQITAHRTVVMEPAKTHKKTRHSLTKTVIMEPAKNAHKHKKTRHFLTKTVIMESAKHTQTQKHTSFLDKNCHDGACKNTYKHKNTHNFFTTTVIMQPAKTHKNTRRRFLTKTVTMESAEPTQTHQKNMSLLDNSYALRRQDLYLLQRC